jgi:hypothetical protein
MMLDYLVEANNPALVDEGVSGEASPVDGILYGSDQRILSAEELEKW